MIADKTSKNILSKYDDFVDICFLDLVIKFLKHIRNNNYIINLLDN